MAGRHATVSSIFRAGQEYGVLSIQVSWGSELSSLCAVFAAMGHRHFSVLRAITPSSRPKNGPHKQ